MKRKKQSDLKKKLRAYGIGDDVSPEVAEEMVALIEAGAHRGQWAQEVSRRRVVPADIDASQIPLRFDLHQPLTTANEISSLER
ncbi:MAG: hypothetical protein WB713_13945 [Methyloceanibacter sp.]